MTAGSADRVGLGYGDSRVLAGTYEQWRDLIADAVRNDAPPSPELIYANEMLSNWESFLKIGKVSSFPVTASVNLTDVCNARCSFCAYVPERVSSERVTLDQVRRADWLKFCRTFTPNGRGLGEPFAHPQICEILELIRELAPFIRISIISNGSIMRDRAIDAIVGFVDVLKISLNATRKETYEATMHPLKWDATMENLRRIRDAKQQAGVDRPYMRAGFVMHRHNMDEMPELPALARELGFTDIFVNTMSPPPSSPSRKLMTKDDSVYRVPELAAERLSELQRNCRLYDIGIADDLPPVGSFSGRKQDLSAFDWPDVSTLTAEVDEELRDLEVRLSMAPSPAGEP